MPSGSLRYLVFFVILVCNSFILCAQQLQTSSSYIAKTYTTQDGLPHNYVLNISQDKNGYLWVGTVFGLCRYDGTQFLQVHIPGMEKKIITGFVEIPGARYWIWTKNDGDFFYDGKNIFPAPDSLAGVRKMPGYPENIFTVNWHRKEYYSSVHCSQGRFLNYPNRGIYLNNSGDSIEIDRAKEPGYFIQFLGYANNEVYYFTDKGLYAWSPEKKLRTLFKDQLTGKRIYACYYDSKKRFWIDTHQDGILVSQPGNETTLKDRVQISNNLIAGFFEDRDRNMWIAGFEGLTKVSEKKFETFRQGPYGFLTDITHSAKNNKGDIYFFSETTGFSMWKSGKFHYRKDNLLRGHMVDAVCSDDRGRLWGITRANRIFILQDGQIRFVNDQLINTSKELDWHILFDPQRKKIWVPGDTLLLGDEKGFSYYSTVQHKKIFSPGALAITRQGTVLAASSDGHLYAVTPKDVITEIRIPAAIAPKNIYRMFTDADDNIWLSYPGMGLLQCRLQNDSLLSIRKFGKEEGLINDLVNSLVTDKEGRVWIATKAGIVVLDIQKKTEEGVPVYPFRASEGLPIWRMEWGRLVKDDSDHLWYNTGDELLRFNLEEIQLTERIPTITFEKLMITNTKTSREQNFTEYPEFLFRVPVNPILKYYNNTITVFFKAPDMSDAGNVRYSYFLSNLNNHWSNASKSNMVTFTNLRPGRYTFNVKARTNNFSWSVPATFSFTILKPYWQSWWFKTLIALVAAGIIYGIYRYRLRQIIKMQMIRNNIARDLHDDLGSTLNSVKIYANVAAIEKDNDRYLEKIKESTQVAITSLRDIIWVLDEKKDSLEHLFTRISQFAEPVCEANHINFHHSIDENIYTLELHREEKRNLYLIVKEVINNSIKYASCQNISVQVSGGKRNLTLQITDDGIGFDEQQVAKGNGLNNIRTRANEIDYQLEILSTPQMGTSVILEKK